MAELTTVSAVLPEDHFPELAEVLTQVREHAYPLVAESYRAQEAEGERMIGRSNLRPQVRFSSDLVGRYEVRDDIEDRFRAVARNQVQASQPIWHWGSREHRRRIHELYARLIESEALEEADRFLAEVRESWLSWFLVECRRERLEQRRLALADSLDTEADLLEDGQSSQERVLELELELSEAEDQRLRLRAESERYARRFAAWADTEVEAPSTAPHRNILRDIDLRSGDELVAFADEQWYEGQNRFRHLEWQLQRERRELAIWERVTWPKLDLIAGVTQDELEAVDRAGTVLRWNTFVGIRVDWPLFDGGRAKGEQLKHRARIRRTERRLQQAEAELQQTLEQLRSEVNLHRRQAGNRELRLELAQSRLDLAEEAAAGGAVSESEKRWRREQVADQELRILESRVAYLLNRMYLTQLLGIDR